LNSAHIASPLRFNRFNAFPSRRSRRRDAKTRRPTPNAPKRFFAISPIIPEANRRFKRSSERKGKKRKIAENADAASRRPCEPPRRRYN